MVRDDKKRKRKAAFSKLQIIKSAEKEIVSFYSGVTIKSAHPPSPRFQLVILSSSYSDLKFGGFRFKGVLGFRVQESYLIVEGFGFFVKPRTLTIKAVASMESHNTSSQPMEV